MNKASTSIVGGAALSLSLASGVFAQETSQKNQLTHPEKKQLITLLLGENNNTEGFIKLQEVANRSKLKDIIYYGVSSFSDKKQEYQRRGEIVGDIDLSRKVSKILQKITSEAAKNPQYANILTEMQWEIDFIENKDFLDIRSYPLGKIFISKTLLQKLTFNDDELTLLISHEIAHILERHFIIVESKNSSISGKIIQVVEKVVQGEAPIAGELDDIIKRKDTISLLAQQYELDADEIGFTIALPLLKDLHSAISYAQKLSSIGGPNAHLQYGERVGQMERLVTEEEENRSTIVWLKNRINSFIDETKAKINTAYISVSVDLDTYRRETKEKFASILGD